MDTSSVKENKIPLQVNGEKIPACDSETLASLLRRVHARDRGILVSLNQKLIKRIAWESTPVHPGDSVEVFTAFEGG